ncbi:MAG TPA: hypothetical protein EYH41_04460 [Novosphingobium capsulatum]|nr:hypothetical protein [Novosphingobium capsulatum]
MAAPAHQWGHDALAADLARRLRNDGKVWTWLNATIGAWSGPRPDIMAFPRYRYDLPQISAYEIKVQRSDLLSDLNSGKWRKYLEHCQSVTFAMPHGLAKKEEIPAECGVMFRTVRGWRTERRPMHLGTPCSIQAMAKLLTCHPVCEPYPGIDKFQQDSLRNQARNAFLRQRGKAIGHELALLVAASADGRDPVAQTREQADALLKSARREADDMAAAFAPLIEFLGLKASASSWQVKDAVRRVLADLSADSRVARVETALAAARKALDDAQGITA